MQRTWGKYDSKSAARGGASTGAANLNQMVPVDDANPEGTKVKRAAKMVKIAAACLNCWSTYWTPVALARTALPLSFGAAFLAHGTMV